MLLGQAELALGNADSAVEHLEQSLALRDGADPEIRGDNQFVLAKALQANGDAAGARRSAAGARASYAECGERRANALAELDDWMAHAGLDGR